MPSKKKKKNNDHQILNLVILLISLLVVIFSLFKIGIIGVVLNNFWNFLFGPAYFVVLFYLLFLFVQAKFIRKLELSVLFYVGSVILIIVIFCFIALYLGGKDFGGFDTKEYLSLAKYLTKEGASYHAGFFGLSFYTLFLNYLSYSGTLIMLIALFLLSLLFIVPMTAYQSLFNKISDKHDENVSYRKELKLERQKQKELLLKQREIEEEERKLELARKMNDEAPEEIMIEEIPLKTQKSEFQQKYIIDLDEKEIRKPVELPSEKEIITKEPRIMPVSKKTLNYRLPPLSLLEKASVKASNINKTSAKIKGEKVIEVLGDFGIESTLINTYIGPNVTKFEIKPDSTININRIQSLSDNIKMELAARDIRIEAPIPGRNAIGIEIPNQETQIVRIAELMNAVPEKKKNSPLIFALGKDLMSQPTFCELDKMPHLLIGGATGSGKSVCINMILMSFLLRTNPDDLKLVLIDPKKVEFSAYHDVPHLLWPVITDSNMAANLLKRIVVIMEDRYDKFAEIGAKNISDFNELVYKHNSQLNEGESPMEKLPYIVVVIDELADLMATNRKDVELSIQRITQLARASGIHLIVATQRPSTDVITGVIKSNIPSRISFAVASSIDSRTILDSVGAERLLGNGDMLYSPQGETNFIRLQGAYVTDGEIERVTSYIKKEASPKYDDTYFALENNGNTAMSASQKDSEDSLYDDVVEYVCEVKKASTSLLQRKFGIGYNRAARLIDMLEDRGIIGPANGSKPREVYKKKED